MNAAGRVSLRPVTNQDEPFLLAVYASTREQELALLPFDEEARDAFVRSQHEAQRAHYAAHHPNARFQLVLVNGEPAGRLYVDRAAEGIHLIDIALLPEFQGQGLGGSLLAELASEADATGLPITAHVERHNRALGLYRSLGFNVIADREVYLLIERPARASETGPARSASRSL